ncbi:MAG: putative Fe-S cluster assembly protein SufT [Candidatus Neomarinimicrobiota bacterium]
MFIKKDKIVKLERDCEAVVIPFGTNVTLKKGEQGQITQALGDSYTLMIKGNLVRIAGHDADAIGEIPVEKPWLDMKGENGGVNEDAVWEAMKTCYDPEIPVNIVDLGLIYSCEIGAEESAGSLVEIKMTLTAPGCGMGDILADEVRRKVETISGVSGVIVELVWDPPWDRTMITPDARLQLGMM